MQAILICLFAHEKIMAGLDFSPTPNLVSLLCLVNINTLARATHSSQTVLTIPQPFKSHIHSINNPT